MDTEKKKMMTSKEAARYLGISVAYLYRLVQRGAIPCYKPFGKRCYFSEEELVTVLKSRPVVSK